VFYAMVLSNIRYLPLTKLLANIEYERICIAKWLLRWSGDVRYQDGSRRSGHGGNNGGFGMLEYIYLLSSYTKNNREKQNLGHQLLFSSPAHLLLGGGILSPSVLCRCDFTCDFDEALRVGVFEDTNLCATVWRTNSDERHGRERVNGGYEGDAHHRQACHGSQRTVPCREGRCRSALCVIGRRDVRGN